MSSTPVRFFVLAQRNLLTASHKSTNSLNLSLFKSKSDELKKLNPSLAPASESFSRCFSLLFISRKEPDSFSFLSLLILFAFSFLVLCMFLFKNRVSCLLLFSTLLLFMQSEMDAFVKRHCLWFCL